MSSGIELHHALGPLLKCCLIVGRQVVGDLGLHGSWLDEADADPLAEHLLAMPSENAPMPNFVSA